jgi:hypothetical protein
MAGMEILVYPQPASGDTVYFYYRLDTAAAIRIEIFNVVGEKVKELADDSAGSGIRHTPWDLRGVAPGVYLYRLHTRSGDQEAVSAWKKLVIVKK